MDPHRLTAVPVFSDLSEEEAHGLAAFAVEVSVPTGETLIHQGDFSTELYAIEEGTADVVYGDQTLWSLGPGDIIGEIGLLSHDQRRADVIATSPMLLLKLTHWELRRMPEQTIARIEHVMEQRLAQAAARAASESSD